MKLSKQQIRAHEKAEQLLSKDTLTYDEKIEILENWYPAFNNQIGRIASFFTPFDLARDFQIEMTGKRIIDLCAGIGGLGLVYYEKMRTWENIECEFVCIERNHEFVEVGKKILPNATWICADVLDESNYEDLGYFDCAISNPPFGNIKSSTDRKWLNYKGSEFEYMVIEIADRIAEYGAFIIPQGSSPFMFSGRDVYEERISDKYKKFYKETGIVLNANAGIDCDIYRDQWKGASPVVEIVTTTKHKMDQADYFRDRVTEEPAAPIIREMESIAVNKQEAKPVQLSMFN